MILKNYVMTMRTITLKEYSKIPIIVKDGKVNNPTLEIGDYVLLREGDDIKDVGDVTNVYEVIALSSDRQELLPTVIRAITNGY